jgi:hypothetical protein
MGKKASPMGGSRRVSPTGSGGGVRKVQRTPLAFRRRVRHLAEETDAEALAVALQEVTMNGSGAGAALPARLRRFAVLGWRQGIWEPPVEEALDQLALESE